jgi:outer membrane immunogenic protein
MAASLPARASALLLSLPALLLASTASFAGSPYPGWRGMYGTPYTAYKAGATFDDDRRALDGSYRSAPLPMPGTWTGLYVGGHLGAGTGGIDTAGIAEAEIDVSTFMGGLQAGYNMQMGSFVAGFEVDGTWLGSDGDSTREGAMSIEAGSDWLSSARLRLGYATGDMLLYATGGVALGDIDLAVSQGAIEDSMSQTLVGYAVGGGVEYKLTDSWIARVEALHYGFSEEKFDTSLGTIDADADITTIRAGLSLRLN